MQSQLEVRSPKEMRKLRGVGRKKNRVKTYL